MRAVVVRTAKRSPGRRSSGSTPTVWRKWDPAPETGTNGRSRPRAVRLWNLTRILAKRPGFALLHIPQGKRRRKGAVDARLRGVSSRLTREGLQET